jgi:cytochrome c553
MKLWILLIAIFPALATAANESLARGHRKSATCMACHGEKGVSVNPQWPNLAGQKKEYLKLQMAAFKDGSRKNQLMTPMAQALSPEDMEDLATYFSSLSGQ